MNQTKGGQSLVFEEPPVIISAASVTGSKEAEGPLGKMFDMTNQDDLFGARTWEEAESNMQKEACVLTLGKAHVDPKEVRCLFGGDLLRQGVATSMGVEALQIPMFGLYGACSTSGEALALAAHERGGGIRQVYAGRNIQPFRKCGKGVPFSPWICQPEALICPLDGYGKPGHF